MLMLVPRITWFLQIGYLGGRDGLTPEQANIGWWRKVELGVVLAAAGTAPQVGSCRIASAASSQTTLSSSLESLWLQPWNNVPSTRCQGLIRDSGLTMGTDRKTMHQKFPAARSPTLACS
ncbi:hypothetical protein GQ53DRAFT_95049 [Thozetella sp. PMI_491]|nr:hypothetical protein GQ53DRAFT_95049 [Thozetella sp. PMI_491]